MDPAPSIPLLPPIPQSPRHKSSQRLAPPELSRPQPGSLPSSPSFPTRPLRQVNGSVGGKQMAGSGTFLADSPNTEENEEFEDMHDLSLSRNHILRASMVDNLVLSLDSFPGGGFDEAPYTPRSNSYDTNARVRGRGRGHTFSSSTSSENDIQHLRAAPQLPQTVPRIPIRHTARYQKDLQKLPSIFGEDEDSARTKVYEAQRAAPRHSRRKTNASAGGKSDHSSNASSIDLGHLASMNGRLGGPGNRRSRSFDFGSRQPERQLLASDGVPAPNIYTIPDAQTATPNSPPIRKNSTKSSKSAYVKKSRPTITAAEAIRIDPLPQLPFMKSVPSFHGPGSRPVIAALNEHPIAAPRPGFFRRVFGSKTAPVESQPSPSVLTKPYHGRATPVQDETSAPPTTPPAKVQRPARRPSIDASSNKENQPVLTKKSSAFFRRRKKSNSNNVPPPLPLTLASELPAEAEPVNGTSPVSSLRAFMGPYLADPPSSATGHGHPRGHARTNSMQGFYTPKIPPPAFGLANQGGNRPRPGHTRTESHGSGKTLRLASDQPSNLRIPHQDSFLADSSSTEEPIKRTPSDGQSDNTHPDLPHRNSANDLELGKTPSATSLTSPRSNPRSATTRQGSWISDTVSPSSSLVAPTSASGDAEQGPRSFSAKRQDTLEIPRKPVNLGSPFASMSDVSDEYRSAPSTPLVIETHDGDIAGSAPSFNLMVPTDALGEEQDYARKAQQIYDYTDDEVDPSTAGIWLGDADDDRRLIRKAYMELFNWSNQDTLDSLRGLCDRIALKGESQVIDRMLISFAQRWCECNPAHNFKSKDIVHQICYAILLLNTDLHRADIGQKMTKAQFTRNVLSTLRRNAQGSDGDKSLRGSARTIKCANGETGSVPSDLKRVATSSTQDELSPSESHESTPGSVFSRSWEVQVEVALRSFYTSIYQEPLPLFGAPIDSNPPVNQSSNFLTIGLRRTPSVLSKAHSDTNRNRFAGESKSLGARFMSKARSRPRLPSAPGFNSSRTSIDESSAWSPSMSSTWSKVSLGKTLTSMSVDSFGTEATHADYQSSIGFANALSQAIIREDQLDLPVEDGPKAGSLLEDESLELCGAPWAKEGILKHKCHLEGVEKRSKDRNWNDCFAVVEKGYMRLFSFSMTAKSLRNKARTPKPTVVGGGNWQDNAEELWKFTLRHTIASSLPPPGYSKARPYVWALSLPTGAVHLFSVGTPDIVKEFVSTANFWSARLSKEPMMGGISNMEYGWSDAVINRALVPSDNHSGRQGGITPRPSTQMSMRSSIDHVGGVKAKLPGDKIHINDWAPPQQSMFASQLMEVDQLRALQTYVANVEEELQKHNDLRGAMLVAFTAKHLNSTKAMNNWEKKSSYLLREIVKFRTYMDTLQNAQTTKERIYRTRKEDELALRLEAEARTKTDTANALMGVA